MTFKKSPTRLYKNPERAKIMGVCAGLADYLDMNVTLVRVLVVIGAFMTGIFMFIIGYIILGMVLESKPLDLYADEQDEQFWKQTRNAPDYTAAELRKRFRDIERRTADMEAYVTSKKFRLERELKALEE
ncbi:envelope stress response membrane protein PspC [Kordiimonas pumila]|uniref:Envelope stress response membrane protein PspC n=1 Tax=Kordiimonas pumila TaxID=2161677 RepID=A0ABV7D017_9PROT|nr:envelope stress response membrane protein PspC [Kordiimonas pumila]